MAFSSEFLSQNWQNVQLMHIFHQQFISGQSKSATQRGPSSHSDPDIASFPSLHSNQFDECFYLVVIDRKAKGQSIIHMWYIRLKTEITKSKGTQCQKEIMDSLQLHFVFDSLFVFPSDCN